MAAGSIGLGFSSEGNQETLGSKEMGADKEVAILWTCVLIQLPNHPSLTVAPMDRCLDAETRPQECWRDQAGQRVKTERR